MNGDGPTLADCERFHKAVCERLEATEQALKVHDTQAKRILDVVESVMDVTNINSTSQAKTQALLESAAKEIDILAKANNKRDEWMQKEITETRKALIRENAKIVKAIIYIATVAVLAGLGLKMGGFI